MTPPDQFKPSTASTTSFDVRRDYVLLFLAACFFLFLGMSMHPVAHDEGLVLTNSMRVAAGQVPHRDFYINYGPADFYVLAGLFRLFGASVLVMRLFSIAVQGLIVATCYAILAPFCSRRLAYFTAALSALWMFELGATSGSPLNPTLLLCIGGGAMVVPVYSRNVSNWHLAAIGFVAGLAVLFRYDTGLALTGTLVFSLLIAVILRTFDQKPGARLAVFVATAWPFLAAFLVILVPPAVYYLSVASLHDLLHDVVFYPAKYYGPGRGLPAPPIHLKTFDNSEIYLPLVIALVALAAAIFARAARNYRASLITFGLIATVLYMKGLVRICVGGEYLAIILSLLPLAILFHIRSRLARPLRLTVILLAGVTFLSASLGAARTARDFQKSHDSALSQLWIGAHHARSAEKSAWCKQNSVLTTGLCFYMDPSRDQAAEFILAHTQPRDRLFVGLDQHHTISISDNLTYFATQRLPVTKWSQFDPDLQNRADIQTQIIREFALDPPPYLIEESGIVSVEPNDSAKSSGVNLLDDYIRVNYQPVQTFGTVTVWQRREVSLRN